MTNHNIIRLFVRFACNTLGATQADNILTIIKYFFGKKISYII